MIVKGTHKQLPMLRKGGRWTRKRKICVCIPHQKDRDAIHFLSVIKAPVPLYILGMDVLAEHYQQMAKKTLLDVLPNVGVLNDYFG